MAGPLFATGVVNIGGGAAWIANNSVNFRKNLEKTLIRVSTAFRRHGIPSVFFYFCLFRIPCGIG